MAAANDANMADFHHHHHHYHFTPLSSARRDSLSSISPVPPQKSISGARPPLTRRISPGLELRLRRLDEQKRKRLHQRTITSEIGRIPEEQLEGLERLQRGQAVEVRKRGRTWTGPPVRVMPSSGGVRLSGGPAYSETEHSSSMLESDVNSSPISLGTRLVPSDSEDELEDTQKYRMPDIGKTRLHLRTKEPLSPTRRPTRGDSRRQSWNDTPTTPRSGRRSRMSAEGSPRAPGGTNGSSENVSDNDLASSRLSRAGSIYSLSRVSFTGQLSQLISMRLPDADSLAKRISSIPTSSEAAKALSDASEQIMLWIAKASEVLGGLNAEDDVEWAAAGGREGIEEVDTAINRFDRLVQVYIISIERLQKRSDVAMLSHAELTESVKQLESVMAAWMKIKSTLNGIKEQVEIAMEWIELWNSVLGEIGQEMEGLNRLVFEMEEKRHEGAESLLSTKESIDLNELETIIEDQPGHGRKLKNRFSMPPPFSPSSPIQPVESDNREDSSLLALFARMQPLRASLDFLPMRLSTFHIRGSVIFPSACEDLENRRDQLEDQWKKLEDDAESLRRELGEDRWVLVFRNAGKQALKMCESVSRSFDKLKTGIDTGEQHTNIASVTKKIENYEAKKTHYGPAIERVLAIIDKGVLDRLTVNGEILRLQADMKRRWTTLQAGMRELDLVLEEVANNARERQLRDSVSTVMSSERSLASSLVDTPGSSPASSVVGNSRKSSFQGSRTPTPLISTKHRHNSFTPGSSNRPASRLLSSSSLPRRAPFRTAISDFRSSPSPSPSISVTPPSASSCAWPARSDAPPDNRPRFTAVSKAAQGRDFAPLSKFEPSPYAKTPVTPKPYLTRYSGIGPPSTLPKAGRQTPLGSRNASEPIAPSTVPRTSTPTPRPDYGNRKSSLPIPTTPSNRPGSALAGKRPPSSLRVSSLNTALYNGRRSSMLPIPPPFRDGNDADTEESDATAGARVPSFASKRRSPSALAGNGRRSSMMPLRSSSRLDDPGKSGPAKPKWR